MYVVIAFAVTPAAISVEANVCRASWRPIGLRPAWRQATWRARRLSYERLRRSGEDEARLAPLTGLVGEGSSRAPTIGTVACGRSGLISTRAFSSWSARRGPPCASPHPPSGRHQLAAARAGGSAHRARSRSGSASTVASSGDASARVGPWLPVCRWLVGLTAGRRLRSRGRRSPGGISTFRAVDGSGQPRKLVGRAGRRRWTSPDAFRRSPEGDRGGTRPRIALGL